MARDSERLQAAKADIVASCPGSSGSQRVAGRCIRRSQGGRGDGPLPEATRGLPTFCSTAPARQSLAIQDHPLAAYEAAIRVDYLGTVIPTRYVLRDFIARGSGHIINVSSVVGFLRAHRLRHLCTREIRGGRFFRGAASRNETAWCPGQRGVSAGCRHTGFAQENRTKPAECTAISRRARVMQTDDVARAVLDGVRGIVSTSCPAGRVLFRLKGMVPGLVRLVLDHELRSARRKLNRRRSRPDRPSCRRRVSGCRRRMFCATASRVVGYPARVVTRQRRGSVS